MQEYTKILFFYNKEQLMLMQIADVEESKMKEKKRQEKSKRMGERTFA